MTSARSGPRCNGVTPDLWVDYPRGDGIGRRDDCALGMRGDTPGRVKQLLYPTGRRHVECPNDPWGYPIKDSLTGGERTSLLAIAHFAEDC